MLYWISGVCLLTAMAFIGAGYYFSEIILRPKKMSPEESLNFIKEKRGISIDLEGIKDHEEVHITSEDGYELYGWYFGNNSEKKAVILNHGIRQTLEAMLKFVPFYRELGYGVLVHDFRYHGRSGGENVTFGYREKTDLNSWMTWLNVNKDICSIGMHGESMGSSMGLEFAAITDGLDFFISDCGFSDWRKILTYRLTWDYPVPVKPFLWITECWIRLRIGVGFKEVSPLMHMKTLKTPTFFIHGLKDRYTPFSMSEEMYYEKVGKKEIWLVPEARHIDCYSVAGKEYNERVRKFIMSLGGPLDECF